MAKRANNNIGKRIEIKIVGTDNTPVKNCLEDCSIICNTKQSQFGCIAQDYKHETGKVHEYKLKGCETIIEQIKTLYALRNDIDTILRGDNPELLEKDIEKIFNDFLKKPKAYEALQERLRIKLHGHDSGITDDDAKKIVDVTIAEANVANKIQNDYGKIYKPYLHPLIRVLKIFSKKLDWNKKEQFIVGHREEDDDNKFDIKKCTLYSMYKEDIYFGNIVGTISKTYSLEDYKQIFKDEYGEILNLDKDIESVKITIEIRTRFDTNKDKPYFLLNMLTQGNINFNDNAVPENDDELFDCLLLFRLKKHLMEAYQKGIYRAYQNYSENGTKIKGTIDFARHIKLNMGMQNGSIVYSYREKTADNFLNHLILLAYEHLKKKYPNIVPENIDNDYEVKAVLNLLQSETQFPKHSKALLMRKCENPIAHPYYTEYEELRRTCIKILRDEGFSLFGGSGDDVQGVLYYVPDLWEEFLESKMIDMNFESQKVVNIFDNEDEKYRFHSRPDYVFYNYVDGNKMPYLILDAKFIPRWFYLAHCEGKIKSVISDYNKCIRDKDSLGILSTGVIFPFGDADDNCGDMKYGEDDAKTIQPEELQKEDREKREVFKEIRSHRVNPDYNMITTFYTVPIHVPLIGDKGYFEWKKEFDEETKKQIAELKIYLEFEKYKIRMIDEERRSINEKLANLTCKTWRENQGLSK